MKKLLLSILALCALSMVSTQISAKAGDKGDGQYQKVHHMCGDCGHPKQHCKCAMEVCQKEVKAVEEVKLAETCRDESYCEEGTVARTNKHGDLECVKTIAHEEIRKPICNRICSKTCPPDYKEVTVAKEHVEKVRRENHEHKARKTKALQKNMAPTERQM
ncbi:MAG: hypothetical protein K2X90_03675 [Candidatus Babeliaceae bacterium]|nr:hypothetical protein [Candidatus Babeliaceae bacterium]